MHKIPYMRRLLYDVLEAGSVNREDLTTLMLGQLPVASTTFFGMHFSAKGEEIPESSANLKVHGMRGAVYLENVNFPNGGGQPSLKIALTGGKLARLNLNYPGFDGSEEDFFVGEHALRCFQRTLPTLQETGYELYVSGFRIAHYVVKIPSRSRIFSNSHYSGEVILQTEDIIQGKPEGRLVLRFTQDRANSPEVDFYKEFLGKLNSRK